MKQNILVEFNTHFNNNSANFSKQQDIHIGAHKLTHRILCPSSETYECLQSNSKYHFKQYLSGSLDHIKEPLQGKHRVEKMSNGKMRFFGDFK